MFNHYYLIGWAEGILGGLVLAYVPWLILVFKELIKSKKNHKDEG